MATNRRPGLSSDIQRAIGQRLRQHYAIERSLPARLMKIALTTALAAAVLMPAPLLVGSIPAEAIEGPPASN
jgi:hypothetical protein